MKVHPTVQFVASPLLWSIATACILVITFFTAHEINSQYHARGTEALLLDAATELENAADHASNWKELDKTINALEATINQIENKSQKSPLTSLHDEIRQLQLTLRYSALDRQALRAQLLELAASMKEKANSIRLSDADAWDTLFSITGKLFSWIGPALLFSIALFYIVWRFSPAESSFLSKLKSGRIGLDGISFENSVPEQKRRIQDSYDDLRHILGAQYISKLTDAGIQEEFDSLFLEFLNEMKNRGVSLAGMKSRSCIYVPSYVDEDLIQATNYVVTNLGAQGERRGRVFSQRYGIIGRSFRMRKPVYNPKVSSDTSSLIEHWGLTFSEAEKQVHDNITLLAAPLGPEGHTKNPIGIIYLEVRETNALDAISSVTDNIAADIDIVLRSCASYNSLVISLDIFSRSLRL